MKKKYNANNLYIGRIMYISNEMLGPFHHETKLKYIFEAKSIEQPYYEEIFTGMKIQRETTTHKEGFAFKNFNTPYIIDIESFINYFPDEMNKTIHMKSMILRMNDINSSKNKEKQQNSVKTKIGVNVKSKKK